MLAGNLRPVLFVAVPAVLALLLGSCNLVDIYDYVYGPGTTVTVTPARAKVGEAVKVTLTNSFRLHENSRVPKRTVSDITLGVCFTRGLTKDDTFIDPNGFCSNKITPLPARYQILSETTFYRDFGTLVVERGKERTVSYSFSFTATEAGDVTLVPNLLWNDDASPGGNPYGGDVIRVTFE